jgi:hypothetical protein
MRRAAAIVTILACGGLAASAAGRSTSTIGLPLHGTAILSGSHVRCGSALVQGRAYIDCGVSDPKHPGEPKPGGYLAYMGADGTVKVFETGTNKTIFSRTPASVHASPAGIPVRPGDTIVIAHTSITCNASHVSRKPTIICYFVDKHGVVRPHSYSFGISDTILTTLGWDASGHAHLLKAWRENG